MDLLLVLIKQNYYQLHLTSNWYFFNKDNIFFFNIYWFYRCNTVKVMIYFIHWQFVFFDRYGPRHTFEHSLTLAQFFGVSSTFHPLSVSFSSV